MTLNKTLSTIAGVILCIGIGVLIGKRMTNAPTPAVVQAESRPASNSKPSSPPHDELIAFTETQIKESGIGIDQAGPRNIGSVTQFNGEIKANEDRTAHVVPQLAGIVKSVSGDMGQQVKKNQILAVISSTQLSELRSDWLAAKKRKELAQITFEREKKLWEEKISSEQDYLQAKQQLSEMTIAFDNATQKLSALGATMNDELNRYELRAPFDGMIVAKHITQGEVVKEDANVFTISDLSTVWAEIVVPAQDLEKVRVGIKAIVNATSLQSTAQGTVTFVSSLFGEQTRTATARITLKNPNMAWRPGLFVTVDLTENESRVPVAVLSDAIQTINNQPTVFVQTKGGFIPQVIQVGRSNAKYTEVIKGLAPGAPYVAQNSFVIKAEQGKSEANEGH